jgi:hypothetical protein
MMLDMLLLPEQNHDLGAANQSALGMVENLWRRFKR